MLERLTHDLRLDVLATGLRLHGVPRWLRGAPVLLAEIELQPAAGTGIDCRCLAAGLATLSANRAWTGRALHVVLADALARLWHVAPPPGAMRMTDLRAAAALRFQTLYGEPLEAWQMHAAWDARHPFVAVALRLDLLAALRQGALAQQLTLVSITPHFIGAWNRWCGVLRTGAWFGVLHGPVLTLGVVAAGRLQAVRSVVLPPEADFAWLERSLWREALLLDLPAPALLQVCGAVPAAWCLPAAGGRLACQALEAAAPALQAGRRAGPVSTGAA